MHVKKLKSFKSRIWEKKEAKYAKTLAKIQVTAIFLKQVMRRNVFPKFIEICMKHHAGTNRDGHQRGGGKPAETPVIEFCYKSVNYLLKNHKT